jgi:hypothetical protein
MSHQFELALRQYVAVFDGKNDSPDDFQAKFDALYHPKFHFIQSDGRKYIGLLLHASTKDPIARDVILEQEKAKYTAGTKMTLVHLRKIGLDCFDVMINEGESSNRVVITISDKQAVVAREIDDSLPLQVLEASCKSAIFKFVEMGTYGTNM